jgi:hypothetical protein
MAKDMAENCTTCGVELENGQIGECDDCQEARTAEKNAPKLRTWCYARRPSAYEIASCACGNPHTEWSEFEKRLWCSQCKIDFIPLHNGIFDGPIPIQLAIKLGMSFDRVHIATGMIERYNVETMSYDAPVALPARAAASV